MRLAFPVRRVAVGTAARRRKSTCVACRHVITLHLAAMLKGPDNSAREMVGLLLSRPADVDVADAEGKTPLHHAIVNRETSELLLEKGTNMSAEDFICSCFFTFTHSSHGTGWSVSSIADHTA